MASKRIYLSPPHIGATERELVNEALESGWIAPVGPQLDAFEKEFSSYVHSAHAVALSSGTAALHLALRIADISTDDEVIVPAFTFCASVNPILYLGGRPVFLDSEKASWNLDPNLLETVLAEKDRNGQLPKAIVVVHLYGQCAQMDPIMTICERYGVTIIEDAAEALGATYEGKMAGSIGRIGAFSFNGNKIITTSSGGMLVTDEAPLADHARKLANQAREPVVHYEHTEIGYNYRMSNILAAIGRGQLSSLDDRIQTRRQIFSFYHDNLNDLPGLSFMPEASWGRHTRWLTCITINPSEFGADREDVRLALEAENIEARPLWKPMHLQPVYKHYEIIGGTVAESLFETGLCLPSGSNLTESDLLRIISIIRSIAKA